MNTQITSKIADILKQRKAIADEPKREKERLEQLELKIRALDNLKRSIVSQSGNNSDVTEGLKKLEFTKLIKLILEEQKVWQNLHKRFSRPTINIGVVGRARQGKSTFLQNVAGLSDAEIPSGDRMPCTSVQSNIYYSDTETYANVYFYSEDSFLEEVIRPYYKELGFSSSPNSLIDFEKNSFPPLPTNHPKPAKAESMYKHLRDEYYAHLNEYKDLLQPQESQKKITKEQIKEYVSQEYDDQGNPTNFTHLAVKKVDIFCRFPEADVEKIGLVDMPGLGDTRLGDEERMIRALGQDVDFIQFIRKPEADGDFWRKEDIDLSDSASQALQEKLPLEKWAFMVLNLKDDGSNRSRCQDMENTIFSKGIKIKEYHRANCKNPQGANLILGKALDYLANNIVRLDREYMSNCKSSLKSLQDQVKAELKKAESILQGYGNSYSEFTDKQEEFISNLKIQIGKLRKKLTEEKNNKDTDFQQQVEEVIKKCEQLETPSEEEIEKFYEINGRHRGIYDIYAHFMRVNLLKQFHEIDNGLTKSIEKKKSEVAQILRKLGLQKLTDKTDGVFFEVMAEKIPATHQNLKLGFDFISSFQYSYKGKIQQIVWQNISRIFLPDPKNRENTNQNQSQITVKSKDAIQNTNQNQSQITVKTKDMRQELQNNLKLAIEACKKYLEKEAVSVNRVGISMVEEFADHITLAKDVEKEWNKFLHDFSSEIWTELQELENRQQVQQEWFKLIKEANSINEKLGIQL